MGRPSFQVTEELRGQVATLAGAGWTHEEIALAVGCDPKTLRKHFEDDLATGAYGKRMAVVLALHGAAVKGNVAAAKAYLAIDPKPAVPDQPSEPKADKVGKKEQAQADAKVAHVGSDWESDLAPRGARTLN